MERTASSSSPPALLAYIGLLLAGGAVVTATAVVAGAQPPGHPSWVMLPVLGGLLVAAEYLLIRFRYAGEINALNAMEAALAPLLFAYPAWAVVATVAAAMIVGDTLRRNQVVKGAFNVAQWSLSGSLGAVVVSTAGSDGITAGSIGALIGALILIGVANQLMFTAVLALAQGTGLRNVLRGLAPVVVPGWLGGWAANVLIGLLFVFAFAAHPASAVLFVVPLLMLHFAYRGYAAARSDRVRLAGLHRAASTLSEPLEPVDAIPAFLEEVVRCFEARAAALTIATDDGWVIHTIETGSERAARRHVALDDNCFEVLVARHRRAVRIGERHRLGPALRAAGWRECIYAPLLEEGIVAGGLLVYDQIGLEGFEDGELAVMEALARETAGVFAKGALVHATIEERTKLSLIVDSTSDGILAVAEDGSVRSWNAAMEAITGWTAADVLDDLDALARLDLRTEGGDPVALAAWATDASFPERVVATARDGSPRLLSCSYSPGPAQAAEHMLIVIARDVSAVREIENLREEYGRLARVEASHRAVVDQLQEAVMPATPDVDGADLGVAYLPSDPSAPTGGDLYDWQVLADGDVHLAVIDVLGHGVAATKDALAVIHALRLVALEGCPLGEVVARSDELLAAQKRDLVATVLIGRYNPYTGTLRLAGGGHPPPLLVTPDGAAREIPVLGGAVGWPGAGSESVVEVPLQPGSSIVMFTDGLVEAGRNILTGMEELVEHARTLADLPADAMAARLLGRSRARAERPDDALALVLRRTPVAIKTRWSIDAEPSQAHALRKELAAWLGGLGLDPVDVEDAQLMVSELLTNAVEAAASKIEVRVAVEPRSLAVEVSDDGPGRHDLDELGLELPPPGAERGRGLYIVRAIADYVGFHRNGGPTVRAVRLLGHPVSLVPPATQGSREVSPA